MFEISLKTSKGYEGHRLTVGFIILQRCIWGSHSKSLARRSTRRILNQQQTPVMHQNNRLPQTRTVLQQLSNVNTLGTVMTMAVLQQSYLHLLW